MKNNKPETIYRFENKFVINNLHLSTLQSCIRNNPFIFSEIYQKRFINNIYFDTVNFKNYQDNIDGLKKRIKVRIRWYGRLSGKINNPTLELKIKNGAVGYKVSHRLNSFILNGPQDIENIQRQCINQVDDNIAVYLNQLEPKVINRYLRYYYLSGDEFYRITLDDNLSYFPVFNNFDLLLKYNQTREKIIELKYPYRLNNKNIGLTQYFPFRVTKSSKYINGINLIYK